MVSLQVEGGTALRGQLTVSGAKNSALAALVAAALAQEPAVLEGVPVVADVAVMVHLLRALGVRVEVLGRGELQVDGSTLSSHEAPYELVRRMRASFYVASLLLGALGKAVVPLPGGCALGSRPVDFHLKGFEQLGARIEIRHGSMYATAPPGGLKGASVHLSRPSVGATVQLMMASCRAQGVTVIENAALEPEVVDVANLLNAMGARIRGAGTSVVQVHGVQRLSGTRYTIIPDRIEAGTWLVAAAATGGDVTVRGALAEHLQLPLMKLKEAGFAVSATPDAVRLASGGARPRPVDLETAPYPGFPTDLQQPFVALLTLADGTSVVRETIFDRFRYVDELRRMGADIRVERDTAIVRGVPSLSGARVEVTDLRAGAALVIAALAARGESLVEGAEHIDRGYEDFEAKLRALGARVRRLGPDGRPDPQAGREWEAVLSPPAAGGLQPGTGR